MKKFIITYVTTKSFNDGIECKSNELVIDNINNLTIEIAETMIRSLQDFINLKEQNYASTSAAS